MNLLAFGLQSLGTWDLVIILMIGLLLFGRKLPEVGRSLGKGIVEFKKGLKGVEDEIDEAVHRPSPPADNQHKFDPHTGQPTQALPPGAKFDPYTGKPIDQVADTAHATEAESEKEKVG